MSDVKIFPVPESQIKKDVPKKRYADPIQEASRALESHIMQVEIYKKSPTRAYDHREQANAPWEDRLKINTEHTNSVKPYKS